MKKPIELTVRSGEQETEISYSCGDGEDLLEMIGDLMIWAGLRFGMSTSDMLDYLRDLLEDDGKEVAEYVQIDEATIRKMFRKTYGDDDDEEGVAGWTDMN